MRGTRGAEMRWAWAEIDSAAISKNVAALKALTRPKTLFMAVVKADGYGHGAAQAARAAIAGGADRLGVATVMEGIELREAGIAAPILLLSEPPEESVPELLEHRLTPTVTTREFAVAMGKRAASRDALAPYHLKIDTGMNRIGVHSGEAAAFARNLADFPGLKLEGTFTHLATADVLGDWEVTRALKRFEVALDEMRTEGVNPGIVHAANSPATILYPESHYSMVRCGIAIYGLQPSADTEKALGLVPAMSVKARASLVKRIGMGDSVSYGYTWTASAPTTIATLPLGYADGVHRVLSNSMDVLIGGKKCRQVGRVCMDQLMVEVERGNEVRRGDEAVIVGEQGGTRLRMETLAKAAGTINYELACGFGLRLERHYR
ncbi:MAG: alanine racemase [Actinomycetota bacterium]|nr:alanine racemase [Actinomycetota bacterium]